ncbi:MAG: diguanylate cyclase domain-containing protein, partial [Hominilimicola sp.]
NPDRRDYVLMVMDIDDFKNVNDTYGHLYGDAVIAMAAKILKNAAGNSGVVGRYGGDEFFVFLKAVNENVIGEKADEIIKNMKNFHVADGKYVTCSIGIAVGSSFDCSPDYKMLFEKADKALYSVKNSGKSHWEIYNEEEMARNTGHAIDYEIEDDVDNAKLLESKDIMKVFLELSASARTSDAAVYRIIRYVAEKFGIDWLQIMQVNCREDLITIKYEWCNDVDFRNNAGRSGYYVHSDIMKFRDYFDKHPVFVVCPENTVGFSMKFQREFEKNMRHSVLYNANITTDDSFYMFVCTRFNKENKWQEEESLELNAATKIMTMYVSQADKETENERKYKNIADFDKKTGLYTMQKFYEQIGRLRKLAAENDESVAIIHTDINNFLAFNRKYGIDEGDKVILDFVDHINGNENPEHSINAHIDGTDIFLSALRIKKNDRNFIKEIDNVNKSFCEMQNKKYPGANIILKTGIYILKENDIGGDGIDFALMVKRAIKDFDASFCALYEE